MHTIGDVYQIPLPVNILYFSGAGVQQQPKCKSRLFPIFLEFITSGYWELADPVKYCIIAFPGAPTANSQKPTAVFTPFGMQMREQWEMPYKGDLLTNRYLYNGKEMQDDMGRIRILRLNQTFFTFFLPFFSNSNRGLIDLIVKFFPVRFNFNSKQGPL